MAANMFEQVKQLSEGGRLPASAEDLRRRRAAEAEAYRAAIDFFRLDAREPARGRQLPPRPR